MSAAEKNERFQTRMPSHVMEKLTQAAGLVGATLNQFIVQAAWEKAQGLLEQERVLNLTSRDAEVFFEALENPPSPGEALIQAAEAYKKTFPHD